MGHVLRPTDHWGFIEVIVNQDETSHYLVKALLPRIIGAPWLPLGFKPSLLFPLLLAPVSNSEKPNVEEESRVVSFVEP